jgi:CRP-like cAMP-binding protein
VAKPKKIDTRPLKEKLARALAKQKWEEALEACIGLREAEPKDDRNLLKLAELSLKLDKRKEGLEAYGALADLYANDGRLPRAISITKIMIEKDPNNEAVQKKLALLYAKRGLPPAAAEQTAADDIAHITGRLRPPRAAPPPDAPAAEPEPVALPEIARAAPPAAEARPSPPVARRSVAPAELEEPALLDLSIVEAGPEIPQPPRSPLFSDLAPEELAAVMSQLVSLEFSPGDAIVHEGDAGDSVFVIARGEVRVRVHRGEGSDVDVATLGEGAFFGEFGMFMDGRRHATVEAVSEVELLELRHDDLERIFPGHPRLKEVLASFYRERALDTALAVSRLFGDLPARARSQLVSLCTEETIDAGTQVLAEGQEGPGLYLVKRGVLKVESRHTDGARVELARLGCGDIFGEISLLSGVRVTADVEALVPSAVLRFARADILAICERHPEVRATLEAIREQRIHESIDRLTESGLV